MVLPEPARLSVATLAWLLAAERIGEPHPVLASTAVWRPRAEEQALDERTRDEIAALGWYDRKGTLDAEVTATLVMLCRATSEFFGWISRGEATAGVLTAGLGRHGILAVRDGDAVWLNHIGRTALARTLVGQLPDVPAGPGQPITVPRTPAPRTTVRVGALAPDVRRVRHLVALPRTGGGELYAAARDRLGRYLVSEPVRYADTRDGRYVTVSATQDQLTVSPAGPSELVTRLTRQRLTPEWENRPG